MADFEFNDTIPQLTLEPELEPVPEIVPVKEEPKPEEAVLSEQERALVAQFAEKIDLENALPADGPVPLHLMVLPANPVA